MHYILVKKLLSKIIRITAFIVLRYFADSYTF